MMLQSESKMNLILIVGKGVKMEIESTGLK